MKHRKNADYIDRSSSPGNPLLPHPGGESCKDVAISLPDDHLHHPYEKPRSLSGNQVEPSRVCNKFAIFNALSKSIDLFIFISQILFSLMPTASSSEAIFSNNQVTSQNSTRIQNQCSCIRSMNDISAVKDDLARSISPKSGSNSSSRESVCASSSTSVYLTPPTKTTLHKSISTPSILAAQEGKENETAKMKNDK